MSASKTSTMAMNRRTLNYCSYACSPILILFLSSILFVEQVESFSIVPSSFHTGRGTIPHRSNQYQLQQSQSQTKKTSSASSSTTAFFYIDPESPQAQPSGIPKAPPSPPPPKEQPPKKNHSQPHSIQQHSQRSSSSRRRRQVKPQQNVVAIHHKQDYENIVLQQTDRIVVVRYHSSYCKACQQISVAYGRLAKQYSPKGVKFVDIAMDAPSPEAKASSSPIDFIKDPPPGVPFGRIYFQGSGLVEEIPIARRHFSKFKKVLGWYVKSECEIPEDFFENPHVSYENENLIL